MGWISFRIRLQIRLGQSLAARLFDHVMILDKAITSLSASESLGEACEARFDGRFELYKEDSMEVEGKIQGKDSKDDIVLTSVSRIELKLRGAQD